MESGKHAWISGRGTGYTLEKTALLAAIEEGVSIQIALGKVIRAIGIKEFSARIGIASPNILRAINARHNPTQETLNRLLKPFRLKLSLAPIEQPKSRHAA